MTIHWGFFCVDIEFCAASGSIIGESILLASSSNGETQLHHSSPHFFASTAFLKFN